MRRLTIVSLILISDFIFWVVGFWIVGMRGFGASYVNEVLGTLLIACAIYYRKHLTSTRIRSLIYPIACCFAGYALFKYVIGWFVSGYVYQSSLADADRHIVAFFFGIPIVLLLFLANLEFRKDVLNFFRRFYKKCPTSISAITSGCMIHIDTFTKPLTKFLRYIPLPSSAGLYVCGHEFEISGFVENFGNQTFSGGNLHIVIKYAFGNLHEEINTAVPMVNIGEKQPINLGQKWGVLAQGHAIFLAKLTDSTGSIIPLYNKTGKQLPLQKDDYTHIYSFYSLSRGELYTLIALLINAVALLINIFKNFF
jgi:hypothetical protein